MRHIWIEILAIKPAKLATLKVRVKSQLGGQEGLEKEDSVETPPLPVSWQSHTNYLISTSALIFIKSVESITGKVLLHMQLRNEKLIKHFVSRQNQNMYSR